MESPLAPPPPGLPPDPANPPPSPPPPVLRTASVTRLQGLSTVASAAAVLLGLIIIAAPLGTWFELSGLGVSATVNGWGMERSDLEDPESIGDGSSSGSSASAVSGWIVPTIPDGTPISVLGSVVLGIGALTLQRARTRKADPTRDGRLLGAVLGLAGAAGAAWTLWSWVRVDRDFDRQVREAIDEGGFAALLAEFELTAGFGLILTGLALVALSLVGILAFVGAAMGTQRIPGTSARAGPPVDDDPGSDDQHRPGGPMR